MDNIALKSFYKQFPSEQACLDYLETVRWPTDRDCPHCHNLVTYKFKSGKLYKCAACKKQFSPKTGTIFSDSHVPLQDWFMAISILTSSSRGISSVFLSKQLEITQKSAWLMLHRLRYAVEFGVGSLPPKTLQSHTGIPSREKPYRIENDFEAILKKILVAPKPQKD
jgi:transposase-like protein